MVRVLVAAALLTLAGCGAARPTPSAGGRGDEAGGAGGPGSRAAGDTAPAPQPPLDGRLPRDVRPVHYALEVALAPAEERATGTVAIELALARPTDTVWLHGVGLHVSRVRARGADGAEVSARWQPLAEGELVAVRVSRALPAGQATLTIAFDAALAPRPGGLFRRRSGGDTYAFSRFEATWARHAFPCFDEPGLTATFDVALVVPRELAAVTNTRAVGEEDAGQGRKRVRFATTPPLPTYRLAWAVGPLDVVEAAPVAAGAFPRPPIALRAVAARGQGARMAAALREATRALEALEQTLGGAAPLDALDLIAVPGLGQDELLASEPGVLADAVLREVCVRWAERVVATTWWDEVWAREALAGWMQRHLREALHPELDPGPEDARRIAWTMGEDARDGARPVRRSVETAADVADAFDARAWAKGALVLGMVERWTGLPALQAALQDAASRPADRRASVDELLAALGASGQDVGAVVRSFVDRAGVPVVAIERRCEAGRASLALRQSRWLPVGAAARRERTWKVPVCARYPATGAGGAPVRVACTLLDAAEGELALPGAPCTGWVMPNADAAGYYRWSLPFADERALQTAAWPALTPRERVAVATNLAAGVYAGTRPAGEALALLPGLLRARERPVLELPAALLGALADDVVGDATRPRIQAMARRLYAPIWARLGWQPPRAARPDAGAAVLRGELGRLLALQLLDPTLRTEAAFRGRAALAGGTLHPEAVVPELLDTALAVAVEVGDRAFFEGVLALLSRTEEPGARRLLLGALAHARDPALATRALDLALDDHVSVAEAPVLFATRMQRREDRVAAWQWLQEHWEPLFARVGPAWIRAWTAEVGVFCDVERAAEVEGFLGPRLAAVPDGAAILTEAVEPIGRCAAWADAQRDSATRFFRGN